VKIFYSARANDFYRDDFHGARFIFVPDPEWTVPVKKVPDPEWVTPVKKVPMSDWVRPLIEIPNPEWEEGAIDIPETLNVPDMDAVAPIVDVPDLEAVHPLIDIPDTSALAPSIEVPNPNCLLPPESELVEVSEDRYQELRAIIATSPSVITSDDKGHPIAVPAPGPTPEQVAYSERALRDKMLLLTDPLVARHRDELEAERLTTLAVEQYKQLQGYRQDLRDWPESEHFPAVEYRPEQPAWLADSIG
jgi:hypothetical protein